MKCKQGMYNFMKIHFSGKMCLKWSASKMPRVSFLFAIWQICKITKKNLRFWERWRWVAVTDQTGQQTCKPNCQTPSNNTNCVHTEKLVKKRAEREEDVGAGIRIRMGRWERTHERKRKRKRKCNRSAKFGSEREILWYIQYTYAIFGETCFS